MTSTLPSGFSLTGAVADALDPPELKWRRDPVRWARERAKIELWSKQREIFESVRDNPLTTVKSCHSAGKGLWVETPLPTPTGWVRMGDVKVADLVYDESGSPTRVTAVSEVRHLDCYRVTFTDNSTLIADGDHLWNVILMSQRRSARGLMNVTDWRDQWDWSKTINTRELVDIVREDIQRGKPGVPISRMLQTGDDVELLIPPYVLGAWLSDGCSWNASFANDPKDDEICEQIRSTDWLAHRSEKRPISVLLRAPGDQPMAPLLRTYDLVKNKHIPASYLRASYVQRLELLRGLMDTDGSVGNNAGGDARCSVGFKHERLARQTYELIRSLGWRASIKEKRATLYGKDCGPFYVIQFVAEDVPFHLTRKARQWKPRSAKWTLNTVRSIQRVPTVPTRCITVDSPRGLYLAGEGMNVTHNSFTAASLTCWWIDVHPPGTARVITTAPTSKQVDAVLWYEINKTHERLGLRGRTNKNEWYLGDRMLVALGRKPPDHVDAAFQGLHAKYLLVILDEAYGIPKRLWDEASTLASNEYGRILAIGNPDGPGEFEENCKDGTNWNVIHISYRHTPNFTGEQVSRELSAMLIHPRWVEERRKKWGQDSALFQSKCEGDFPSGGDPFAVVQHNWAMQCRVLELPAMEPAEAGIDVAAGGDRTVIRERRGPRAGREDTFIDQDPMRTVGRLCEKIREWGIQRVKIDVTGLGWGIYGRIRELSSRHNPSSKDTTHSAEVIDINFGAGPPPGYEKKFLNMRAYLWWQVGRENSRLSSWDLTEADDDVVHELTMPRYEILDSYGKIKIEPKDHVIKRLGFSPDRAEALLLAFANERSAAKTVGWDMMRSANLLTGTSPMDNIAGGWA